MENLQWDWGISRQRNFGVPIPVWYCDTCDDVVPARVEDVPIDPVTASVEMTCPKCGSKSLTPEVDVLDTWATSSLTPLIAGGWLDDTGLFSRVTPMSMRPQGHDIIRTWAFYTIVQSYHLLGTIPWSDVMVSGWGLAPAGKGKISKSRSSGALSPGDAIGKYSADAVRYWAAGAGLGKDVQISEDKMAQGKRLVTKLWNVARFAYPFIHQSSRRKGNDLAPIDHWMVGQTCQLVRRVTGFFSSFNYAAACHESEIFFLNQFADNYIEFAKRRLYDPQHPLHGGACYTLENTLVTILKVFAPIMPFVTDEIFRLLRTGETRGSIHVASWPELGDPVKSDRVDSFAEEFLSVAGTIRRWKSEQSLSLGSSFSLLEVVVSETEGLIEEWVQSESDLLSVTRADRVDFVRQPSAQSIVVGHSPIVALQH